MPGGPELLIVLLIVVVLFGGAKLPKLARSVGQAKKEFSTGLKEGDPEGDAPLSDSEQEELQRLRSQGESERDELNRLRNPDRS